MDTAAGSLQLAEDQIEGRAAQANRPAFDVELQKRVQRNEDDGLFGAGAVLSVFEFGREDQPARLEDLPSEVHEKVKRTVKYRNGYDNEQVTSVLLPFFDIKIKTFLKNKQTKQKQKKHFYNINMVILISL